MDMDVSIGAAAAQFQDNRLLKLHFPHGDGPSSELLIQSFHGIEALSRDFQFELELLSTDPRIALKTVMGKMVSIELEAADGSSRWFNGYVTHFAQWGSDGGYASYHMMVSPWTAMLQRRRDQRIFQNQPFRETAGQIFSAYGAKADFQFKITGEDLADTFRVQHNETDHNYFHRRCEERGWYYWFEHRRDGHTLVIADDSTQTQPIDGGNPQVRFHQASDHFDPVGDCIDHWQALRDLASAKVTLRTYDFKQPAMPLEASMDTVNQQGEVDPYEVYEYPGAYAYNNSQRGEALARLRMEEIEAHAKQFQGSGNMRWLQTGRCFQLIDHYDLDPNDAEDGQFLLIEVQHHAHNNYLQDHTQNDGDAYRNNFIALRKKIPFRPGRGYNSEDVRTQGLQTATVVGPKGEDLWCDEHGRVYIQFPWDRRGYNDERASCAVRVNNPLGGGQMGGMFIPRIGQEVVVDFLSGNPDMPVIMGRVYNQANMPPWGLPASKNQMGFLSRTIGTGDNTDKANAFRFDDTPGNEELWMHAEKNQRIEVENDESHWVGRDRTKNIDRDETSHIKRNRTETVDANETITVHQNRTERVDLNESISIGQSRSENVGINETILIGQNKMQTIGMTYMQNVGLAKMTNVGLGYDRNVGAMMLSMVGLSRDDIIGQDHTSRVGKTYKLVVAGASTVVMDDKSILLQIGQSKLVLEADGTITLQGVKIAINGDALVSVDGQKIDLN